MIRIEDLSVAFGDTEVVKHVDLELSGGEILGVVGESGSGKSVTALTLMGLSADTARVTTGRILFDGVTLQEAGRPRDKALYRSYQGARMSMVFQEPMTSLNPTQRAGRQVEETLRLHTKMTAGERREKVLEAFRAVGLKEPEKVYASYPHQLSGGMRQRVMIAMAVILQPELIVADEPTTALDVTIQNQIMCIRDRSKAILGMNCHIRGEIRHHTIRPQMVFQDPYSSLNPTKTIGWLLQEPLRAAGALDRTKVMTKTDMEAAAYDMLRKVGLEESYFHRRPSQLSGGQRQRVSIGQALITSPGFLVADEPVSALDVTIQAQIMELLQRLQEELHLAYLFISHDINVVYQMCDRIMIMKEGRIIETGDTEEVFAHPREDYTKLLLGSS